MAALHLQTSKSHSIIRPALYTLSTRHFAKRGIYRGRRRKLRLSKPGLPRGDKPRIDDSPTRTLTPSPWGPPRYPIPRVQESSVEFHQNLNSLCRIVQSKIQCLGLSVASHDHAAKAAVERMERYSSEIAKSSAFLHFYRLIVVDDILGFSRDIGSRNTLWIPSDFTVKELLLFLESECISDPKLCEIRRIDAFLNQFQPNNWRSVDRLSVLDGSMVEDRTGSMSSSRRYPVPWNEYREVEPVELLKVREKARNTVVAEEQYIDTSDIFSYWTVPNELKKQKPRGVDGSVPEYAVSEESSEHEMEGQDAEEQIDGMERILNAKLIERKQWFIEQMERSGNDIEVDARIPGMELLCSSEMMADEETMEFEADRDGDDEGQHLRVYIAERVSDDGSDWAENEDVQKEREHEDRGDADLCSIHFVKK